MDLALPNSRLLHGALELCCHQVVKCVISIYVSE